MKLSRSDLEKEIINYDRQKLIDQCLKIFDSNTGLVTELDMMYKVTLQLKAEVKVLKYDVELLRQRKWWQLINDRLVWQIERRRKRRESINPLIK